MSSSSDVASDIIPNMAKELSAAEEKVSKSIWNALSDKGFSPNLKSTLLHLLGDVVAGRLVATAAEDNAALRHHVILDLCDHVNAEDSCESFLSLALRAGAFELINAITNVLPQSLSDLWTNVEQALAECIAFGCHQI